jgi:inositol-phosphate phosphatase/L-galactose 1-phosphate phosphatase/histidinol-phosphatase
LAQGDRPEKDIAGKAYAAAEHRFASHNQSAAQTGAQMPDTPIVERCPDEFIAFAGELADANGRHALEYFQTPFEVIHKADDSPVTIADKEGEELMRTMIRAAWPAHGIMGEEIPPEGEDAEYVWLLDPIDGTVAFVAGMPMFGMLITLLHHRQPILGVIDHPALRQRWIGARGHATTFDGKPAHVRACARIEDAVLHCAGPNYLFGADRERFMALSDRVRIVTYGGFAYAYGLIAAGFCDIVVDGGMKPHDYMPLRPIVEGAGGLITDWHGRPMDWGSMEEVVVLGDRALLEPVLDALRPERPR